MTNSFIAAFIALFAASIVAQSTGQPSPSDQSPATQSAEQPPSAGAGKSVNDRVFTLAQATRGRTQFLDHCNSCHETSRFQGELFLEVWSGKGLSDLFEVMRGTMPEDNPGSLRPQQYADIVAYILQLNAFPAGDAELSSAEGGMRGIRIEPPKP